MRKLISAITLLLAVENTYAQQNTEPCYFDHSVRHADYIQKSEQTLQELLKQQAVLKAATSNIKIIPVVVHVIHNGGTENISDTQIQSQIDVLNEDFRKIPGSNGDGNGVDTEIQFCLANITPDGKCTNGIVRIQSTLTNHLTYQRSMLKNLSYWDNTRYLNMYVVKTINGSSGILGYSSFPGGPPDEDGIVVRHNAFGRTGTVSPTSSYNLGRTTTHEISHWFGLYHTFNGGCGVDTCADGDYVCDTPPALNPNYGCPVINSCSNDVPNVNDQVQNYADYSNDACKSMFTQGQKNRMHATLSSFRWDIWQPSNIFSTGCDSSYVPYPCNVVADFTSNGQSICVGNTINFINKSLNNPISYQWYFPGGTPSTSTAANPTVTYNTVGVYNVTLVTTNSVGTDSVTFINYITVSTPPVGIPLPFTETFESAVFPSNGITIENPDNGITWERDTVAVAYGGVASAKINNLINTNYGQSDAIVLPLFDLTSFAGTPYMTFKWAYARSDANYSDELIVLASTDCGLNFTQIFYRTGTNMVTGPTQTTPYIPDTNTTWKSASISLANYATSDHLILKIVNVTDGGNNLYIDNLNVGEVTLGMDDMEGDHSVLLYPNPFSDQLNVSYSLTTSEDVSAFIYDATGRLIQQEQQGKTPAGKHTLTLNTGQELSPGIYLLQIKIGEQVLTKKVSVITSK
jgi:PKD repeat protein